MKVEKENSDAIPLVEVLMDVVKESVKDTPIPDTGLPKENLESILWMLTMDILESLGAPDTEREFVLCSTLITQVYINTLQEIEIQILKENIKK